VLVAILRKLPGENPHFSPAGPRRARARARGVSLTGWLYRYLPSLSSLWGNAQSEKKGKNHNGCGGGYISNCHVSKQTWWPPLTRHGRLRGGRPPHIVLYLTPAALLAINHSECCASTNFFERHFRGVRGRISTSRDVICPHGAYQHRKWQGFFRVRRRSARTSDCPCGFVAKHKATRTNPLARGTLRVYPRDGFSSAPYLIWGIIGRRYAAPTPFERIVPNSPEANKRRNCHSISIYKVTGCASPANTSGFLLVSCHKNQWLRSTPRWPGE
jgi:hypothetical protein